MTEPQEVSTAPTAGAQDEAPETQVRKQLRTQRAALYMSYTQENRKTKLEHNQDEPSVARPFNITTPPSLFKKFTGLSIALLLFTFALNDLLHQSDRPPAFVTPLAGSFNESFNGGGEPNTPLFRSQALDNAAQASVHGATLTSHTNGWLAAWYGGTREGAKDVQIFLSQAAPGDHNRAVDLNWSKPTALLSSHTLGQDLNRYVKKLGNPVLFTTPNQKVWLFFVSVSVGGWAGSAINVMVSDDGGQTFSPPQRLTTSPFFNVSTLVRNRPIALANGGMVIPVYHEFIGKFCELLWLDADGNITDKQRLSWGRTTLQPSIVAENERKAAVFMRISAPKTHIEVTITEDAGAHFTKPTAINLPNANAAIDAALLPDNRWLLIYNHDPVARDKLSLATAEDPLGPWVQRVILDEYRPDTNFARFSYPVLVTDQHNYHLLYTVERSFIQSVVFNANWLSMQGSITYE